MASGNSAGSWSSTAPRPRSPGSERRLGPEAEPHIRTREELVKDSLRELDARTLAHCGIQVIEDADVVTIAVPRDDLDRVVELLLDDMEEAE